MSAPHASSAAAEPAGHWRSDFSAAKAVAAGTDYADLTCDEQRLLWVEFLPGEGRNTAVEWTPQGTRPLTPPGYSVRSRVYEYGGGALCLAGDSLVFVNEADQQLYCQSLATLLCTRLTAATHCRYGGLLFDPWRQRVIAVEERHTETHVIHCLVAIDLQGNRVQLAGGSDFYNSPCLSPDGQRLAWIEWQRPALPWTDSVLCWADLDDEGRPVNVQRMGQGEAVQQPLFDSQGRLLCLTDRSGHWQPWRQTTDRQWSLLPSRQADHAPAPWQLQPRHYLALPDGWLALNWNDQGVGYLELRHTERDEVQPLAPGYTRFRALTCNRTALYCVAGAPDCSAAVLRIELDTGEARVLARAASALEPEDISRPESIVYPTGQDEHAMVSTIRRATVALLWLRESRLRWLSSAMVGQHRPVIRCWIIASSSGPSAALPWLT